MTGVSRGRGGWGRLKAWPEVVGRRFVKGIDFLLRRSQGVREFSHEGGCILRLGLGRAGADLTLSDGTLVRRGDMVGQLHLWNERLPVMSAEGADLAWARTFYTHFARSLKYVSLYIERATAFEAIQAFCAETAFALADIESARRFARSMGFDFLRRPGATTWQGRFAEFWDNFYVRMLIWTFNPASLRGKGLSQLRRYQLWISREKLLARYRQG